MFTLDGMLTSSHAVAMRKLTLAAAGLLLALGFTTSMTGAHADPLKCTDQFCIGVRDAGYVVVYDGKESNPDPLDGYIGVKDDGSLDCDGAGGPYTTGEPGGPSCP
jgi:hypothetical protein